MSFKRFDAEDLVISNDAISSTVWADGDPIISSYYTSSVQVAADSGRYYYDVYQADVNDTGSALPQFSIAYADEKGSGSLPYNAAVVGKSTTSTVYGQYRSMVLGDEESTFKFGDIVSEYFYAIPVDRQAYKEKLLTGFTMKLTNGTDSLSLTDDSLVKPTVSFLDSGRVYQIVSGSQGTVFTGINQNGYTANDGSYGMFLPDMGLILLNGKALDAASGDGGIALGTGRTATDEVNNQKLFNALVLGSQWLQNTEETVSSNFAFVRVRNSEFNYSVNPSNITGSGELIHDEMINAPQAFITTVGLYNDTNDLLATAKLSTPLVKDFTKEALVRVKLDF